jgi:hypothetical protein
LSCPFNRFFRRNPSSDIDPDSLTQSLFHGYIS